MEDIPKTESIDNLFLELSQFTMAKTGKEIKYEKLLMEVVEALNKARLFLTYENPDADRTNVLIAISEALLRIQNK